MKNIYFLIPLLCVIVSCKKNGTSVDAETAIKFNDPNWLKLEVPAGGIVSAVAGSIEDTLLVTTYYKSYYSADRGITWKESKNFSGPRALLTVQDTIYALSASGRDKDFKNSFATISSEYTLDKGLTWKNADYTNLYKVMQTGIANSSTGTIYQLHYNSGADKNGKGSNYVLRTTISKTDKYGSANMPYPFNEQPTNLHIDQSNHLYITTGGYINEVGVLFGKSSLEPAYLFVSKKAVD